MMREVLDQGLSLWSYRQLHGDEFEAVDVADGSEPGLDERRLYGRPTRPAGFGHRVQPIGWPDPTPMHSAQLCVARDPIGMPHEQGWRDMEIPALHSFVRPR